MAVCKDSVLLANKFRGCLVGALLGDCLGAPYEGDENISKVVLQKYFDKLEGPYFSSPVKPYTDDTAMTKCVAESLIAKGGMDQKDLADRFVKEYFKDPRRGYGQNVVDVFHKLRNPKLNDVLKPAEEQFGGRGSFGNGGAMRIAPVALFGLNNYNNMLHMAKQNTLITHSNVLGVNGALLQCIALYKCLHLDPGEPLDVNSFTSDLKEKIGAIEKNSMDYEEDDDDDVKMPYHSKLEAMENLLEKEDKGLKIPDEEVDNVLGTSVTALHSVPTAIYCFLRAQKEIPDIETNSGFRRTLQYAISLGGDTDTIASMAGALAGSYYGYSVINQNIQKHCEALDKVLLCSGKMHQLEWKNSDKDLQNKNEKK